MLRLFFTMFMLSICVGCASYGFNRGSLQNQIGVQNQATDSEIKDILNKKPNLPSPFKLAIYIKKTEKINICKQIGAGPSKIKNKS